MGEGRWGRCPLGGPKTRGDRALLLQPRIVIVVWCRFVLLPQRLVIVLAALLDLGRDSALPLQPRIVVVMRCGLILLAQGFVIITAPFEFGRYSIFPCFELV